VNRDALRALLDRERVRPDAYSLDGSRCDECLCLEPAEGGWAIFHSERGGRTGERRFATEDEACDFLAARLLADASNRSSPF
jgi:hypothetical protein